MVATTPLFTPNGSLSAQPVSQCQRSARNSEGEQKHAISATVEACDTDRIVLELRLQCAIAQPVAKIISNEVGTKSGAAFGNKNAVSWEQKVIKSYIFIIS